MSALTKRYCEAEADRVLARMFGELPADAPNGALVRALQLAYPFGDDKSRVPYESWLARCRAWAAARAAGHPRPMDPDTTRRLRKVDRASSEQTSLF